MFKINDYYQLALYNNPVVATSYKGVKLLSILDYNTACLFANVDLIQRQIFPYLPPGTPSDHTKYSYLLLDNNGSKTVIAQEWVILDSVVTSEGSTYTLTLNNITSQKLAIVRDQLRLLGISFTIL